MKMQLPARTFVATAVVVVGSLMAASSAMAGYVGDVFYIDLENHNFTQPAGDTTDPQQLLGNPAAPFLNSLVTPNNPNSVQTSYASAYQNVPGVHPSEPNYIYQEAGSNFGNATDADPYKNSNVYGAPNLSGLLQNYGQTWKTYAEDTQLAKDVNGNITSNTVAPGQYTVPLNSLSGTSPSYTNAYNGSNQYNFAPKHVGQVFFADTNGGTLTTPNTATATTGNPEAAHYSPLQQLQSDLAGNTVARYNLIDPDQYNDMHSSLTNGFTYHGVHYTGDQSSVAAGDNFLATIVPEIMASAAYKNNGAIVIWNDETEGGDTSARTSTEIVISPLAKGNAFNSTLTYTHASDVKTLQELFNIPGPNGGFIGDAASPATNDLSNLFVPGAIPTNLVPEPASFVMLGLGLSLAVVYRRRTCRKAD